ncbi:MAG: MBL fold metallo-hydrolase [Alphaproteobacteria bacterium]|nr:MBL fold metallo-hydrolase [Alphaproteobacteria bacterium]
MRVTVLGCGTSGGVPRIGNHWGACDPVEPRNRRRRVSIAVEEDDTRLIVDSSPDLREQCLAHGIDRLDAVLYSHDHADHTHGIDDLRAFALQRGAPLPAYGDARTLAVLKRRFDYCFTGELGYPPVVEARQIDGPFQVGAIAVEPFRQRHGPIDSLGFRFGPLAYSTDVKALPEEAFAVLEGVEVWIVDALRPQPHPTHAHLALTLQWIERVKPRRAILTHMTWEMDYRSLQRSLPAGVEPAYDGMTLLLPLA